MKKENYDKIKISLNLVTFDNKRHFVYWRLFKYYFKNMKNLLFSLDSKM